MYEEFAVAHCYSFIAGKHYSSQEITINFFCTLLHFSNDICFLFDQALLRYNNLKIRFQRVTTGDNIVISGANLGSSGRCVLGQATGFPGTPTSANTSASDASWMMACANGNPVFTSVDNIALNYVY